jgi:hypothetical protein
MTLVSDTVLIILFIISMVGLLATMFGFGCVIMSLLWERSEYKDRNTQCGDGSRYVKLTMEEYKEWTREGKDGE